jgi:hypothetical protein
VEETLITSMESCKILIKLSLNLHKFYTVLPCQCFFLGILLCSQSGDHREEDAEKQAIIPRKIWLNLAINQLVLFKIAQIFKGFIFKHYGSFVALHFVYWHHEEYLKLQKGLSKIDLSLVIFSLHFT